MASDLQIQGEVVVNSEQAEGAFNRVGNKAQQMAKEVSASANKAGQAVDKIGDGAEQGANKFTRAESRMREAIKKSTRDLELLGKTASQKFEANLEFKGLDKAKFEPFLAELRKAEQATKQVESGMLGMGNAAALAGRVMAFAFSGAAITGFLGKVVSVQREFDVLNSSLKTVTGSSAAAEREMAWLKQFAKETPFGLAQATQGFVKMKALGLDPTRASLTSFGNTASAMGKDLNQMVEAVADASTGEFERLKEFGIKAKVEGDKVSLTFQGVTKTIENSAKDITKYLEDIGNNQFGGAMAERAKTLDGAIAGLGDTWDELFRSVSSQGAGTLIYDTVNAAAGAIEDATTILKAFNSVTDDGAEKSRAFGAVQEGLAITFETVAVMAAQLSYVLSGVGREIGGWAAQLNALEIGPAELANPAAAAAKVLTSLAKGRGEIVAQISRDMKTDAEAARRDIDALTDRILNARKAQEELAKFKTRNEGAANDPRRTDAPKPADTAASDEAKSVAELAEARRKLYGVDKDYLPTLEMLHRQFTGGKLTLSEYQGLVAKLAEGNYKADNASKSAASAAKAEQDAYRNLVTSIKEKIAANDLELSNAREMTDSQKLIIKLDQELLSGKLKLTAASEKDVRAKLAILELQEKEIAARKEALKVAQATASARTKEAEGIEAWMRAQEDAALQSSKSITDRIAGLANEEEAVKLARSTNISLAEAIERVAIARLREKRDGSTGAYKDSPAYKELTDEIELREKLASGIGSKESREKSDDAAKKSAEDWKRTADGINQDLTNAFEQSFMNGESLGKNLAASLKNIFANTVLRPVISAVLSPISGAINGLVSGVTGGAGSAGGSSGLGTLLTIGQQAYNAYNGTGIAGAAVTGVQNLLGIGAGAAQAGNAAVIASSYGGGPAAIAAAQNASLAAGGSATGGAGLGAAGAGGIAAIIMLGVINALGGMRSETMVGSGLAGTLGNGSALTPWQEWREGGTLFDGSSFATHNPLEELSQRKAELQRLRDSGQGESNYAVGIQAVVTDLEKTTKGLAEQTEVFTREIGKGYKAYRTNVVDMADSLGLAGDSVKDFAYTLGAQDLNFQGLNPEQIQAKIAETFGKAGDAATKTFLGSWKEVTDTVVNTYATEQMTQASDGAFQTDTTVTKRMEYQASVYAKTGETAIQTLTRLSTSFNALNETADALGFGIQKGSLALADFSDKFIEAFGGLEKFTASTGAFLQNYYTDTERREYLIRSGVRQAEKLGIQGLTEDNLRNGSREQLRDFVNTAASNPELYADALDLANYLSPIFGAFEEQAPVVQEVANVVDELTQAYQNAVKSLTSDRDKLAVDKLRAQGDEAGAKSLERQQYLDSFVNEAGVKLDEGRLKEISTLYDLNQATRDHISVLNERNSLQDEINALTDTSAQALERQRDALDESNRALFDNLQATKLQQTIAQELPGVLDKFRTPGQRIEAGYSGISEGLAKAGVQISPADLAAASLPQILAAATELYNLGTTSDDTRLALIRAASGLADLKAQAVDMATSVTDAAYAALEREVGVRREVVQETIDDVRTVFDAVSSAAKSLYGDVGSTAKMLAGQGRSFIAEALSTAQLTGYLPDGKELQEAITAATSGIGKQVYATQFDADRERLILAGQLSALGDISGDQLTEQEKQLKALDGILEANREQIDAIRGIDVRVLGVDARIAMLTEAVLKEASVRGVTVPGATAPGATQPTGVYQGKLGARYDANTDTGYQSITGLPWSGASVRDAAKAMMEAGNARGLYDLAVKEGFSLATMDKILQIGDGTAEDWARAMKLPIFHEGTNFVPRTGFALLERGEQVVPAAFNPFAGGSGVGNTALVAAVDRLTAQNAELLARLTQIEKHSKRTAAATNGSPDQPVPNYITNEKLVTV